MKKLNHYLLETSAFQQHLRGVSFKDVEACVDSTTWGINLAPYVHVLACSPPSVVRHFWCFFESTLNKAGLTSSEPMSLEVVRSSMLLTLCFVFTVQYYFS